LSLEDRAAVLLALSRIVAGRAQVARSRDAVLEQLRVEKARMVASCDATSAERCLLARCQLQADPQTPAMSSGVQRQITRAIENRVRSGLRELFLSVDGQDWQQLRLMAPFGVNAESLPLAHRTMARSSRVIGVEVDECGVYSEVTVATRSRRSSLRELYSMCFHQASERWFVCPRQVADRQ
jgi:hypothetical protein